MRRLTRINIVFIVKKHLLSIRDSWGLFIGFPVLVSAAFVLLDQHITGAIASIIVTSLSIFIALFFNVSILLLDMKRRVGNNQDRKEALQETHNCISFLVVVGLLGILVCYGALSPYREIQLAFEALTYFFLAVFFLTVVMSIKNVHVLFDDDIRRSN